MRVNSRWLGSNWGQRQLCGDRRRLAVATTRQPYAYAFGNPLNVTDPSGLFGWNDVWNIGKSVITAPIAVAHSAVLNVESVVSTAFYAPYWGAYQVNSHWQGEPAPLRHFMSGVQRLGLAGDEWFDGVQQCSGYPGATPNDEEQKVSPIPSVIYPTADGQGNWHQNKWSQSWWTTSGPGTDPSGRGHFAD